LIRENKVEPVLNVHDEMQFIAINEIADSVGVTLKHSIIAAGIELNLKCPLDAEYKVGKTWKETH